MQELFGLCCDSVFRNCCARCFCVICLCEFDFEFELRWDGYVTCCFVMLFEQLRLDRLDSVVRALIKLSRITICGIWMNASSGFDVLFRSTHVRIV